MSEKPNTDVEGPTPAVKTVAAKLRCLDLRGETVSTRWGAVSFDRDGLAELEVPEAELPMLRAVKPHSWLAEDHVPPAAPEVPAPVDPPKGKKR